ncbi:MAG TPA: high-potential iron-sulfur protein [Halococcus sp.]|nr:high-potential iron-sulfur protein [Halococcus sp.]
MIRTQNTREDESQHIRNPHSTQSPVRRRFLQLLASGVVVGVAGCSSNTNSASGKTPKAEVNYQNHPNGGQQCSGCQFYQPPSDGTGAGKCSNVKGKIAPHGWCQLYTSD